MRKLTITILLWLFPVFAAGFQSTGQTPTPSPSGSGSSDQGGPRKGGPGSTEQGGARKNGPGSTEQGGTRVHDRDHEPRSDAAPAGGASNSDVQANIQSAIQKDPTLASANVTVDVKNGKSVDLSGTVPSKDAKDSAERIALENAGGMKVKNHLKVASATTPDKSDKSKPDTTSKPK